MTGCRGRTLFVLGAGFSKEAGYPLAGDLGPLVYRRIDEASEPDIVQTRQALAHARADLDPSSRQSFDEIARACTGRYCGALRPLRLGCRALFWDTHKAHEIADSYRSFARWAATSVGVVSFNWDLVVEWAAGAASVSCKYDSGEAPSQGFRIVKPHGSINWIYTPTFRPVVRDLWSEPYPQVFCPRLSPLADPDPRNRLEATPMILPGEAEILDPVWAAADDLVARAEAIVFIGYSGPEYDPRIEQWIQAIRRDVSVEVVDPCPEVGRRFGELLSRPPTMRSVTFSRSIYGVDPA